MNAFRKLLRANVKSFTRDRATLFWTFAFPLLFIVIFGAVFGGNSTPNYDVGLVVNARGPASDAIVTAREHNKAFTVHEGSEDSELQKLKNGDRKAVVVVGPQTSGPLPVSAYSDPAQTTTQQILLPLLQQTIGAVNQELSGGQPAVALQA